MKVKAIFKGTDGSLGYKHNMEYVLKIKILEDKSINIETEQGNNKCDYSSFIRFMDNWDCIRKV